METARVDICYRPLRVAWAIHSADKEAFRRAVRLSHTLWGGRFNPVVMADRPDEARQLVELYRVDVIIPIGTDPTVVAFTGQFPHLITPYFPDRLFLPHQSEATRAHLLDIHNALVHWRISGAWKAVEEQGIRQFVWDDDDPLADTFLIHYGAYPAANDIGIDYLELLGQATLAIQCRIEKAAPVPLDVHEHPSIAFLSRHGLRRHYSVRPGWDYPGFYSGSADSLDDLVTFWNLRAADISLQFFDPAHAERYAIIKTACEERTRAQLAPLDEHRRKIAVWSRTAPVETALAAFAGQPLNACQVGGPFFWNGGAVRPPMMILGEASSLGVFGREQGKPKFSFTLTDKPFCSDKSFYTQHLVASVTVGSGDTQHTFHPPYVPEWNEFYAREMHFQYNKFRIEPERNGVVIDVADHDTFLFGLPNGALVAQLFHAGGFQAKLSGGGLIARQLLAKLGGLNGARAFKIPGVRRLLRTYGPRDVFTKRGALQLIGARDPDNPTASFDDHKHLYIEPRPHGTDLTTAAVFAYLVEKDLFRMGAELTCQGCSLPNWVALDDLRQQNTCELCGASFDATRQLVGRELQYRRSGLLGLEKNSQGAVPVLMVLQQLDINLNGLSTDAVFAPSYDIIPSGGGEPFEIDLAIIVPSRGFREKADVILGECKDRGGVIDQKDIENLRRAADALPQDRFETYILLAKLAPFTTSEIELAKCLNGPYQRRVIMLTARELEPYHLLERTQKELGISSHGGSAEELANITTQIYFTDPADADTGKVA
jgi:hypothetical protein